MRPIRLLVDAVRSRSWAWSGRSCGPFASGLRQRQPGLLAPGLRPAPRGGKRLNCFVSRRGLTVERPDARRLVAPLAAGATPNPDAVLRAAVDSTDPPDVLAGFLGDEIVVRVGKGAAPGEGHKGCAVPCADPRIARKPAFRLARRVTRTSGERNVPTSVP